MAAALKVGLNAVEFSDILLKRKSSAGLEIRNLADTDYRDLYANVIYALQLSGISQLRAAAADISFQCYLGSYLEVARMVSNGDAYFGIPRAGPILPDATKTRALGSVSKYWNQAFIDAIICSDSIDLDPTVGDAVIYFKHDGAANEASLRYDKVNKRLELWIDGAIVGYCNAALGWVNGAP